MGGSLRIISIALKLLCIVGMAINGWDMLMVAVSDGPIGEQVKSAGFVATFICCIAAFASWLCVDLRGDIDVAALRSGKRVKVGRSPRVALAAVGVVPMILGLAFDAGTRPDLDRSAPFLLLGFAVVVAGVAIYYWRQSRRAVLLTPQGVLDARVSAHALPWTAIRQVETNYQKGIAVSLILRTSQGSTSCPSTLALGSSRGAIELTALELTVRLLDLRRVAQQLSGVAS